jgi:hypothetical protein
MAIVCTCPHCGHVNLLDEKSWGEKFTDKLPENLAKAALITTVGIVTGGLGALLLGGLFYGKQVVNYFEGQKITCSNCSREFNVHVD